MSKKWYINSYLELKKVPIEDANLDKSLVKGSYLGVTIPQVQA